MDSSSSRHDFSPVKQAFNLVKQLLATGEMEVPLLHLNVRLSSHAAHHSGSEASQLDRTVDCSPPLGAS